MATVTSDHAYQGDRKALVMKWQPCNDAVPPTYGLVNGYITKDCIELRGTGCTASRFPPVRPKRHRVSFDLTL